LSLDWPAPGSGGRVCERGR